MSNYSDVLVVPESEEISIEDGAEMLRLQVSDKLGIQLHEFFNRLDSGEYDSTEDNQILRLVMLVPFAR